MGRVNGFFADFWGCKEDKSDTAYITIALKGGFVKSLYQKKDTEEVVEINPAAGSIFLHVLKNRIQSQSMEGITYASGKSGIYITLTAKKAYILERLEAVLKVIFENKAAQAEVEEAKKQTIDKLKRNFKNKTARNWYYMFEFTEMGKRYTYQERAKALETISYQEFYTYEEALVNPKNSIVMVNNMLEQEEVTSVCNFLKNVQRTGIEYVDYGYVPDESGLLDCYLLENMSCGSMGALYFIFPDVEATPTEKMFLLMYINEIMFREHGFVSVDTFDASITYVQEPIQKYERDIAGIWTKENIANARDRLLRRFENLIRKPAELSVYRGELLFSGVDMYKLIHDIQVCDSDTVYRVYKKADAEIVSGTIINEGGRKDGRRTGIKTK